MAVLERHPQSISEISTPEVLTNSPVKGYALGFTPEQAAELKGIIEYLDTDTIPLDINTRLFQNRPNHTVSTVDGFFNKFISQNQPDLLILGQIKGFENHLDQYANHCGQIVIITNDDTYANINSKDLNPETKQKIHFAHVDLLNRNLLTQYPTQDLIDHPYYVINQAIADMNLDVVDKDDTQEVEVPNKTDEDANALATPVINTIATDKKSAITKLIAYFKNSF